MQIREVGEDSEDEESSLTEVERTFFDQSIKLESESQILLKK